MSLNTLFTETKFRCLWFKTCTIITFRNEEKETSSDGSLLEAISTIADIFLFFLQVVSYHDYILQKIVNFLQTVKILTIASTSFSIMFQYFGIRFQLKLSDLIFD